MKKKLLWIGIPSVLIIAVAGFVFFNMKNLGSNQNIIVNIEPEQDVQSNHGTMEENIGRTYLFAEECYDEDGKLNNNYDVDDNGNIVNCYNEQGQQQGKWITYTENRSGKYKHEENYKEGKKDGKSIHYDENGRIDSIQNYKDGERDGEIVFYENGKISEIGVYINGEPEGEHIEYFDGERMLKTIYKSGEMIDMQENDEVFEKWYEYYKSENLRLESIRNNFSTGGIINNNEFNDLVTSVYADYTIFYDEIIADEEIREFHEDMYRRNYENKSWELLALYSMMNCSEDPSNSDTYLFNLEGPKLAQETYFKNCPKGCRYSDEEDVDFVCE